MDQLERDVRDALIEQNAQELCVCISDERTLKEQIELTVDVLVNALCAESDNDEKQETEVFFKMMAPVVAQQMQNPEFIKKHTYGLAQRQWKSVLELRSEFSQFYKDVEELEQYKDCFKELFKCVSVRDRLVNRLVDIARKEGIEQAVKKETTYGVFRDFVSTPDEYRTFAKNLIK